MPTPNQPPPLPRWRRLSDGWHVEIVHGATRTACNQEFRDNAAASDTPMPTHCDRCRLHHRAVKQAAAAAAAAQAAPKPQAPAGQGPREAVVLALLGDLRVAVGELRQHHGRDAVRALPWGTTLDAMDSGRQALHPDDQQAEVDDRLVIRWLLAQPMHVRARLLPPTTDKRVRMTLLLQGGALPPCPEDDPDGELALVCLLQHDGERHVAEAVVRHRGASGREAYWALPDDTPAVAPELVAWAWLRGPDAPELSP